MTKCPYCESAVSQFANICPNCGKAISKESVQKELEQQKNNNIEKAEKRKLRELGKEKYLPLVMVIIHIIFILVNEIQAFSIVYDTLGNNTLGNDILFDILFRTTSEVVIHIIIESTIMLVIPISFLTKIYQSSKGYTFRNIQMGIDICVIVLFTLLILRNIIEMKTFYAIQNVFLLLGFVISFILCIRMKKTK